MHMSQTLYFVILARYKSRIFRLTLTIFLKKKDQIINDLVFEFLWSGKRDSNSRRQPWQGCTLPLSYSRSVMLGCPKRMYV